MDNLSKEELEYLKKVLKSDEECLVGLLGDDDLADDECLPQWQTELQLAKSILSKLLSDLS